MHGYERAKMPAEAEQQKTADVIAIKMRYHGYMNVVACQEN
jgi:hypothetical protein